YQRAAPNHRPPLGKGAGQRGQDLSHRELPVGERRGGLGSGRPGRRQEYEDACCQSTQSGAAASKAPEVSEPATNAGAPQSFLSAAATAAGREEPSAGASVLGVAVTPVPRKSQPRHVERIAARAPRAPV